jgi:hypothetical protein
MVQMVEYLSSKSKALSSNPSTVKKEGREENSFGNTRDHE